MTPARTENAPSEEKDKKEAILDFEDVHMIFTRRLKQPVQALRGLSLRIGRGSVVGLLGPNGCGKTTAVSCLTGLLYPQKGNIRLYGEPVRSVAAQSGKKPVGVVLEDTRLPPFLKVESALASFCGLRDIPFAEIEDEFERICEITGIRELLGLRINGLSK